MPRYFIEVAYKGTNYAGFQWQDNANTIQAEVEKAINAFFGFKISDKRVSSDSDNRESSVIKLTGASRTDTGVHARQNFFHFDSLFELEHKQPLQKFAYHINAMLPHDIMIREIRQVQADAHCRFDALSRTYHYYIHQQKDPFLNDRAFFYPYPLQLSLLKDAAYELTLHHHFESFSKKRSQVHTYICNILKSEWMESDGVLVYKVTANRFLRGMVRGFVGTMLLVGREKVSLESFKNIIVQNDSSKVDFSVPAHGLFLTSVQYDSE